MIIIHFYTVIVAVCLMNDNSGDTLDYVSFFSCRVIKVDDRDIIVHCRMYDSNETLESNNWQASLLRLDR